MKSINFILFICILSILPMTVSAWSIEYNSMTNEIPPTHNYTVVGYYEVTITTWLQSNRNITIQGITMVDQYDYFDIQLIDNNYSELSLPYTIIEDGYRIVVNIRSLYGLTKSTHPDTFTLFYTVDGMDTNQTETLILIVPEYPDYVIDVNNDSIEVDVGIDSSHSLFRVNNTGNTFFYLDVEVNTETDDILNYIDYPTEVKVFTNLNNEFNIKTQIPNDYTTGIYYLNFTLSNDLKEFQYDLTINVGDSIVPTLEIIAVEDTMLTLDNLITVTARDNINITTVSINITDIYETTHTIIENNESVTKTEIISEYIETITMSRVNDTANWVYNYINTDKIKNVLLNITAIDDYNNSISESVTFQVDKLNSIHHNDTIEFDKRKIGFGSEIVAFILDYNTEAYVNLVEIKPSNINYSIYLIDPSGNKDYIDQDNPAKAIKVNKNGEYKLRLVSDYIGEVHGTIFIEPPKEHVALEPFVFTGIFVNYTVPAEHYEYKSISIDENCDWVDTGIYEDSYYDCIVKRFPPNVDPAQWDSGYTAEQIQELRNDYQRQIDNREGQIGFLKTIIILFIALICFSLFVINYHANLKESLLFIPTED